MAGIVAVAGITATGGAVQRSCRLPSSPTPVVCWFIDPAAAQGNRFWVTLNPTGSPGPTVAPTPLSLPFYVLAQNGREERHWLGIDTGYPMDISASRALGGNARIIPNRPTSGLTWVGASGLCDLTTNRGACTPAPSRDGRPSPADASEGAVVSTVLEEPLVDHDAVAD
jgi:hypothetical protein